MSLAKAETLLTYNFSGTALDEPSAEADNVSGGTMAWFGMNPSDVGFSGTTDSAFADFAVVPTAFDSDVYLEFQISADSGYELSLDNVTYLMGAQNNTGAAFEVYSNVRSSADAYASNLTINPGSVTTATHDVPFPSGIISGSNFSTDMSGSQFDNISSLTIRIYPSIEFSTTDGYYRFKNIQVTGTVMAVPEPVASSWALICCAGILVFVRRYMKLRSR